ncbi:MAG: hypothetical protein ACXQS8_06610 [Candidatus Helarchaeales archaeon]
MDKILQKFSVKHVVEESPNTPGHYFIDGGVMGFFPKETMEVKHLEDFAPPKGDKGIFKIDDAYYNMHYIAQILEIIGNDLVTCFLGLVSPPDGDMKVLAFDVGKAYILLAPRGPPDEEFEKDLIVKNSEDQDVGMAFLL